MIVKKQIYSGFYALFVIGCFVSCRFPQRAENIIPHLPDTAAYEKAHFGMTEKEYQANVQDTLPIISNGSFNLHPFFIPNDRRMYMLEVGSSEAKYEDFDKHLVPEMNMLIEKFTALYGDPGRCNKPPKVNLLEPNRVIWNCEWIFPSKVIKIGIGRLPDKHDAFSDNSRYMAVCQIVNKPLLKIANQQIVYIGTFQ